MVIKLYEPQDLGESAGAAYVNPDHQLATFFFMQRQSKNCPNGLILVSASIVGSCPSPHPNKGEWGGKEAD